MKRSIKDTMTITVFLLFVVAFSAFHLMAGLVLVFLWSFANVIYDVAINDIKRTKKGLANRPK